MILSHIDVGGGSVDNTNPNSPPNSLARIPLRWMIRECFKAETGIMFNSEGLRNIGFDPASLWPVRPRPPHLQVPQNAKIASIPKSVADPTIPRKVAHETALPNNAGINPDALTQPKQRLSEEEHELLDALQPVYDQLSLHRFWWILELWPIKQRYQHGDKNEWVDRLWFNLGRPRFIPKQRKNGVKVHRSVKMRMDALHEDGSKYVPRAHFDLKYTTWVD